MERDCIYCKNLLEAAGRGRCGGCMSKPTHPHFKPIREYLAKPIECNQLDRNELKKKLNSIYGLNSGRHFDYIDTDIAHYVQHDIDVTKELFEKYQKLKKKQENKSLITKVIFNPPATIVMWKDGTKTVVKCQDGDVYDPEKGLAMAMCKKMLGNQGYYYDVLKKWLPEEKENDNYENPVEKVLNGIKEIAVNVHGVDVSTLKKLLYKSQGELKKDEQCNTCRYEDEYRLWEPKKQNEVRFCLTCKYMDLDRYDEPCRLCNHCSNWEPTEES